LADLQHLDSAGPIGIFDSGVGGLSVFQRIRADLPHEYLLYVADSGHAPYGSKSTEFISQRAFAISDFLLQQGVKAIVVACNTATAAAIAALRQRFSLPIIGIEPALKPAVTATTSGVVGVLATGNTVHSDKFAALLNQHGQRARVIVQPCPGLADCVERGDLTGPRPHALLQKFVGPLLREGVDVLVLGCTHYPFLTPLIQKLTGPEMTILDPSAAVARQLWRRLDAGDLLASNDKTGTERYFSSGLLERTMPVMNRLLNHSITLETLPEPFRQSGQRQRHHT
jgi:glutamate racemase